MRAPPPPPPHHRPSAATAGSSASGDGSFSCAADDGSFSCAADDLAGAKLRAAQELAARLRRQVQLLEMELLLRGAESRESLTGLLSSLELRDSFRLSDCASDALFMDDDAPEPEEEEEDDDEDVAVLGNESFFVEKLIDPNELTDDEEEEEEEEEDAAKQLPSDCCVDCEQLQRRLSEALEAQVEVRSRHASLAESGDGDAAAALLAQKARAELALLRVESEQRIQRLEFNHVELQKREAAAQQKIDALEAELAHARALSRHPKKLRRAADDEEEAEELLLESGGDRRHEQKSGDSSVRTLAGLLRRRPGAWGRSEVAVAALVALVLLLCVALVSIRY